MQMSHVLHGARLRLAALRPSDVATIAKWWEHGDFLRHLDTEPAVSWTEAQIATNIERQQSRDDCFGFGIRRQEDDALIGRISLDGISWPHRSANIGGLVILDPDDRGQGYGREATEICLRFAFHELNLHRVALTVFAHNANAIRLYERLGFVHEGTHREFFERDGQRHDMLLYGLLRREWEARTVTPR